MNNGKVKKRGWGFLITGLLIGAGLGLLWGWQIQPTRDFDITPISLHEDYKEDYFVMVGLSAIADGDYGRAYARMKEMMDPVDINQLRIMLSGLESSNEYRGNFEVMRRFVNGLESYLYSR